IFCKKNWFHVLHTLSGTIIEDSHMNLFSDAGGAFARRRRDVSNHLSFSCLCSVYRKPFVSFFNLPDHHSALPLAWFLVVGDPFFTLFRTSYLRQYSKLLVAIDETYLALILARSPKAKFAKTFESGLILSLSSRSMESSCFAILVDHRPHRNSARLKPVMKMAAEGSTLIHQASPVLDPVTLPKWYRNPSSMSTPVPQPPAMSLSTPIICSPSPSPHTQSLIDLVKGELGFSFLGLSHFGPLCFLSWPIQVFGLINCLKPNYKRCDPNQLLQKPRSGPNSSLSIISQHWGRFIEPVDRGLQLKHIPPLLLCWYNFCLRTLPLESPTEIIYEIKRVKKNGIMIPSPRSGGYRSFFNPLSHALKQTPTDYRIVVILLLADEQIHLALLVPSRVSAMEPLSTSCCLLTVTITSSNASSADVVSTNRVITCAKLLSSFCLQALMDPSSNFISYLCVAIALPLLCCLCFILSFATFVFLATLILALV
ncbi:unnamed protein product, partial [Arabidopsis halleri]